MIFSDNFHIGTMICNFGYLENISNVESLVNLFNITLVEIIETQVKDRIIYFSMVSNKPLNFESHLKKKITKRNASVINTSVRNILHAKLYKFRTNQNANAPKRTKLATNLKNENKILEKIDSNKDGTCLNIPNIIFSKKLVFRKSFTKFLTMAEDLEDGEILYKI